MTQLQTVALLVVTLACRSGCFGQAATPAPTQSPTPPLLSPQAAYEQATRPLEVVRRSIANWSDAETAALAVGIQSAGVACLERDPANYTGEDLVGLARLCALGQKWMEMSVAASIYIKSGGTLQLSAAYGLRLNGALHAQDADLILSTAQEMMGAVPYDAVVEEATSGALDYLQLAYTDKALTLHAQREPLVLAALQAANATPSPSTVVRPGTPVLQRVPRSQLYADGLAFAALQQYANTPAEAAQTIAALDAALGDMTQLLPDDLIPVSEERRQYSLLGQRLPELSLKLSLLATQHPEQLDTRAYWATALVLFPDWCAQCMRLGPGLVGAAKRLDESAIHVRALLEGASPDADLLKPVTVAARVHGAKAAGASKDEAEAPRAPADVLMETPTFVVPTGTLKLFAATDFPLVVITDWTGTIRFLGVMPENGLGAGGYLDRAAEHVAETWPRPTAKATPEKKP